MWCRLLISPPVSASLVDWFCSCGVGCAGEERAVLGLHLAGFHLQLYEDFPSITCLFWELGRFGETRNRWPGSLQWGKALEKTNVCLPLGDLSQNMLFLWQFLRAHSNYCFCRDLLLSCSTWDARSQVPMQAEHVGEMLGLFVIPFLASRGR